MVPPAGPLARWAAAALLVALVAAQAAAAPPLVDYRARGGERLSSVARRLYLDVSRVDLILRHNDLGPEPHLRLQPGQLLRVPPDAWFEDLRGPVQVYPPRGHAPAAGPAAMGTPLLRGARVITGLRAAAALEFSDSTTLQLGERAVLLIAGAAPRQVQGLGARQDSQLLSGAARFQREAGDGEVALSTPGARLRFDRGEGILTVEPTGATRIAAHGGTVRVMARGQVLDLPAGQGTRIEPGERPSPPRPLPPRPRWSEAPPRLVLTLTPEPSLVRGVFTVEGEAAFFHLQVAEDSRFRHVLRDQHLPAGSTDFAIRGLPPGSYHARVAAIDGDQQEGPAVSARFDIAEVQLLPGGDGQPARLVPPPGLACGLDGAPAAMAAAPLPLAPARAHVLRCLGAGAAGEAPIPARRCGPLLHSAALAAAGSGRRRLVLQLRDGGGGPVAGARVVATARAAALLGPVREAEPGTYVLDATWPEVGAPDAVDLAIDEERLEVPLPGDEPEPAPLALTAPPRGAGARRLPVLLRDFNLSLLGGVVLSSLDGLRRGPAGLAVALDAGRRVALPRGVLSVGLRVGYEDFSLPEETRAPCAADGADPPMLCYQSRRGDFAYAFARILLTLSLPLTYAPPLPTRAVAPYLGVAPQLVVAITQTQAIELPNRPVLLLLPAVHAIAGVVLRPMPTRFGAFLFEAGYRHAFLFERRPEDATPSGVTLSIGYRLER